MNYIRKHWRGQLSLAVSFWINLFLLNSAFMLFDTWLIQNSIIEHPQIAGRVTIIYTIVRLGLVYPWQIIGLWRASKRHIETADTRFWPRFAQVLAIFGVLATFGTLTSSWPIYKELYQIGFTKDEYANYNLKLSTNNTIIHLQGELGFGVSKDVAKLLVSQSNVQGIILDSNGGRIYEGRELSKLILINGLNTYSFNGCYSACTTAFIAGKNRYLGPGANLAFHQYIMGYKNLGTGIDMKKEQEADLRIFQKQGVKSDFMNKLFKTPHDDLWYPSVEELMDSGVIHGIVNPSNISPVKYSANSYDFDKAFQNISAFKTIKKYDPDGYQRIMTEVDRQIKKGASQIELQQSVAKHMKAIAEKTMAKSSNDALINFAQVTIASLKKLAEKSPILCLKNLYSAQYGSVNIPQNFDSADTQLMIDALSNIIVDAYKKNNPVVNTKAAETLMEKLLVRMGEDVQYLEPQGLQNSTDYKRACDAAIKFYELILAEDKYTSGNALRYVFSGK
jgi:hypothetical protein